MSKFSSTFDLWNESPISRTTNNSWLQPNVNVKTYKNSLLQEKLGYEISNYSYCWCRSQAIHRLKNCRAFKSLSKIETCNGKGKIPARLIKALVGDPKILAFYMNSTLTRFSRELLAKSGKESELGLHQVIGLNVVPAGYFFIRSA